ncbi:bifunctional diguanylate cyclase/phosphodiesterase [Nocardiopsis sp. JB363]|uniref:putative bifunctional diguanylate cyclase/phosphodiesterase n=1 Tax=Nocardiopsis sp. JB363 TaxID=1434837 RepID=UPI00097AF5F5|nr:GGDEF domain-containing phosphodiesterase [Nocardiopsis sp. JB363]SIO85013.1 diguanylate cyclase/phosphodiesterase (GGDEF & EAL domains) with PAS/PAC sensor(s) [Nocardiopsis sp. JB363]
MGLKARRLAVFGLGALFLLYLLGTLIPAGENTLAATLGEWPGAVVAGAAGASLLLASKRWARTGADREAHVDGADGPAALRFLGFAALSWCAGALTHAITRTFSAGSVFSLTLGDLFALAALPLFVIGFTKFAPWPGGLRTAIRHITDSYVCAAAVFSVVWLLLFSPLYEELGEGAGLLGFALVYPVADIVVLCLLIPLVFMSPHSTRRAVLVATGALIAIAASDMIGAVTRLTGPPVAGGIDQPVRFLGFALLGALPWLVEHRPGADPRRITGRGLYRFAPEFAALGAVLVATAALTVGSLRLSDVAAVLPIAAGTAVVVLVVRVLGMLEENATLSRMVRNREGHFNELARNSGDVILVLDRDGGVFYVSPGTAEAFGYRLDDVLAAPVTTLIHPEDLSRTNAVFDLFGQRSGQGVHLRLRVRAADGTWRHTESTVSLYEQPGEPDRLLVTTRDISAQVALQDQVEHLTFHDGVTGLPNRSYLEERANDVLAHRAINDEHTGDLAVIFLDLDGFTAVNDSAGHVRGDHMLGQAARRLRGELGSNATLARWGGDEFAVLVEDVPKAQRVVDLAERLGRVIASEPFQVADRDILLTASIGVAFAEPSTDSGELLRNADVAMTRAKERGAGNVEVYAAHMHDMVVSRLELQIRLRRALSGGEFFLEYQPVVDLGTSQVTAVEALVRWDRDGETIGPDAFIGAAEESGLIVPLGEWILREACEKVAVWRVSDWDIGLSVNLSVKQVLSPRFVRTVEGVLTETGLPAEVLTLEVDEEVLLDDQGDAVARLGELRALGVRLAIDDYGMGYASLAHLRELSVDAIKIDPSFIADLGRDDTVTLLTHTIVQLGRDLGVQVVAEGIERPEQLEQLRVMGCDHGQGFLVARPMPASGVESLVGGEAGVNL